MTGAFVDNYPMVEWGIFNLVLGVGYCMLGCVFLVYVTIKSAERSSTTDLMGVLLEGNWGLG